MCRPEKVLTIVITYEPDTEKFIKNLCALYAQTQNIIIFDNGSSDASKIEKITDEFKGVRFFKNNKNIGLPKNYNRAAKYAYKNGFEWLLIFDQDTLMPADLLEKMLVYTDDESVAVIAPTYADVNLYSEEEIRAMSKKEGYSYVHQCISSGSLNRVSTLIELGGFDEQMFIDQVDFDYCKNAVTHGYKILQVNNCIIRHEIGNSRWVNLLGKKAIVYGHGPFRKYYFFRNKVYFARKYHLSLIKDRKYYINFFKYYLLLFYEKEDKWKKYRAAMKGFRAGFRMPLRYTFIKDD